MNAFPRFAQELRVIARLHRRRILEGPKLRLALLVAAGAVACTLVVTSRAYGAQETDAELTRGFRIFYFSALVFVMPYVFGAGAIADEVQSRTLSYLRVRPVSRTAIALGKLWVSAGFCAAFLGASVLTSHALGYVGQPTLLVENFPKTLRWLFALALLGTDYTACLALVGALVPRAAGVGSMLFLASWEVGVGQLFPLVSLRFHAARCAGLDISTLSEVRRTPLLAHGAVLVFVAGLLALALTLTLTFREYREDGS